MQIAVYAREMQDRHMFHPQKELPIMRHEREVTTIEKLLRDKFRSKGTYTSVIDVVNACLSVPALASNTNLCLPNPLTKQDTIQALQMSDTVDLKVFSNDYGTVSLNLMRFPQISGNTYTI